MMDEKKKVNPYENHILDVSPKQAAFVMDKITESEKAKEALELLMQRTPVKGPKTAYEQTCLWISTLKGLLVGLEQYAEEQAAEPDSSDELDDMIGQLPEELQSKFQNLRRTLGLKR
jgi:Rad3-related DNA helicase